jgi:hypothetical protein
VEIKPATGATGKTGANQLLDTLINTVASARWKQQERVSEPFFNGFHRPGAETVETVVCSTRPPPPGEATVLMNIPDLPESVRPYLQLFRVDDPSSKRCIARQQSCRACCSFWMALRLFVLAATRTGFHLLREMKCLPKLVSGLCVTGLLAATTTPINAAEPAINTNTVGQPIEIAGVHNAFRVTDKVYSGSQPQGDAAFAALAKLGVKTIVSVDGGKPEVEAARKHGMRYVHLPIGYDGVPTNRLVELAKVAAGPGPFFVHCHHGLHRGPAAVAIMCEASAGWSPTRAETWMHEAGTAPDYAGLFRSAREFKAPTAAELAAVTELPEIARTSSLVDAMVAIDEHFSWLKQSQKAGWKTPAGHADISPPHEATILWEHYRELARTPDTANRPADFRAKLADAERAAETLRRLLSENTDTAKLDAAFKVSTQTCVACHRTYRNK